jgi:hypothetical protein
MVYHIKDTTKDTLHSVVGITKQTKTNKPPVCDYEALYYSTITQWTDLPMDAWTHIMSFLDVESLISTRRVCSWLCDIIHTYTIPTIKQTAMEPIIVLCEMDGSQCITSRWARYWLIISIHNPSTDKRLVEFHRDLYLSHKKECRWRLNQVKREFNSLYKRSLIMMKIVSCIVAIMPLVDLTFKFDTPSFLGNDRVVANLFYERFHNVLSQVGTIVCTEVDERTPEEEERGKIGGFEKLFFGRMMYMCERATTLVLNDNNTGMIDRIPDNYTHARIGAHDMILNTLFFSEGLKHLTVDVLTESGPAIAAPSYEFDHFSTDYAVTLETYTIVPYEGKDDSIYHVTPRNRL